VNMAIDVKIKSTHPLSARIHEPQPKVVSFQKVELAAYIFQEILPFVLRLKQNSETELTGFLMNFSYLARRRHAGNLKPHT